MAGLNNYDREKLLHDIKRIAKGVKIIADEKIEERRNFIASLIQDEVDRLYQDIEEMTNKGM